MATYPLRLRTITRMRCSIISAGSRAIRSQLPRSTSRRRNSYVGAIAFSAAARERLQNTWRYMSTDLSELQVKLGFWDDGLWDSQYCDLEEYRDEHGDCNVPQSQGSLGKWASTQRQSYKEGKLSKERTARLESIGFVWDLHEHWWSERFDDLMNYKAGYGDCNVPQSQGPLGAWVDKQRVKYKTGKLSQERIARLESIGFSWEPIDEAWIARFDELVDFKNENGDCNVPNRHGSLGRWVFTQRRYHKKGKLSQERIKLLESIGFEWVLRVRTDTTLTRKLDEQWKTRYTELVQYLTEHGNCNVPQKFGHLGSWVGTQRQEYKDGSMPQFRIDYLGSIGFVWTTKRVGNEWLPDGYSKPDPKAIARIIADEKPRHEEFPSSAPEGPKTRANADRDLVEALQEYLDRKQSIVLD